MLVVLDNCEHLIEAVVACVDAIVGGECVVLRLVDVHPQCGGESLALQRGRAKVEEEAAKTRDRQLDHLFERFYRGRTARQADSGLTRR